MGSRTKQTLLVILTLVLGMPVAQGKIDDHLTIAIGAPGSDSYAFGTELWAMSEITLAPSHGVEITPHEVAEDGERLDLLRQSQVQAAIVQDRVPTSSADETRAVLALWPRGIASGETAPAQLVVRKDVDDDVIYHITKAIFEQSHVLKSAHATLGIGQPSQAMTGLDVPIHPGAFRYYQEEGFGSDLAAVQLEFVAEPAAEPSQKGATVEIYRNFDDANLSPHEVAQIGAACRDALDQGTLTAVLGDLSSTGCEIYQSYLIDQPVDGGDLEGSTSDQAIEASAKAAEEQALAAVLRTVRNTGEPPDDLFARSSGQGGPAVGLGPREDRYGRQIDQHEATKWPSIHQPTM